MHDRDWHDGWDGTWWWVPMTLMMIVFWGGLIWVVVTLIRHNMHVGPSSAPPPAGTHVAPDARQILDQRLARGEIDIDDYHARIAALKGDSPRD